MKHLLSIFIIFSAISAVCAMLPSNSTKSTTMKNDTLIAQRTPDGPIDTIIYYAGYLSREQAGNDYRNIYFFNPDDCYNFFMLDTVFYADMTLLVCKDVDADLIVRSPNAYIITDIDSAALKKDITEEELLKSPYCYLTYAQPYKAYSGSPSVYFPFTDFFMDRVSFSRSIDLIDNFVWAYLKAFTFQYECDSTTMEHFDVLTFKEQPDGAVLGMIKAAMFNSWEDHITPIPTCNDQSFFKILFPYKNEGLGPLSPSELCL